MNILFFLIPKINVVCVKQDYTLRQALEKMHAHRYSVIPIVTRSGEYVGTLSEGDILLFLKEHQNLDLNATDDIKITDIERYRSYSSINVMQNMEDLIHIATEQNFVPVVDDRNMFIGIITRKSVITYFASKVEEKEEKEQ